MIPLRQPWTAQCEKNEFSSSCRGRAPANMKSSVHTAYGGDSYFFRVMILWVGLAEVIDLRASAFASADVCIVQWLIFAFLHYL